MSGDKVRLSKLIASRGLASRREAEALISAGRVTVDGEVAKGVVPVVPDMVDVRIDGKPLPPAEGRVVYLFHKPKGYLTTRSDPEGRKTIFDLLGDLRVRVEPVGRLDMDTEGALLLTNDGGLAHRLTHPSHRVPKRYIAKVYRTPDARDLKLIKKGQVYLEDGPAAPAQVRVLETTDSGNAWVEITVTEGRNRLIRRLFAQLGHPVSKLRRETFATVSIRNVERGALRRLSANEVARIEDISRGKRPGKAGKKRGKGFAKAKPKRRRLGKRARQRG